MKAVVGQIKCGDGYTVDKYGNPVEPGNEIPVEKNIYGKEVMSMDMMPVDVVNAQWAREHGMQDNMQCSPSGEFMRQRAAAGSMIDMQRRGRRGLGLMKVLEMIQMMKGM